MELHGWREQQEYTHYNVTKNSVIKHNGYTDMGPAGLLHLIYREYNWYPKAQKIDANQEQLLNIEW